ncbi:hypothetical protein SAMN04488244_10235 [Vibrio hangzhouensis]|uniref:Uncharacterized protein n=1 Tax=Vibrio hangzhouensis TaxID=462991 RepID=A0A1H5SZ76_9VIBR|nr:hypothetical protein SAMN04488244_10235 [Vibrio hangzhouensis]
MLELLIGLVVTLVVGYFICINIQRPESIIFSLQIFVLEVCSIFQLATLLFRTKLVFSFR